MNDTRIVGRRGLLVTAADPPGVAAAIRRAAGAAGLELADVVPAAETVLVVTTRPDLLSALRALVETTGSGDAADLDAGPAVDVPVRYDGADLEAVAAACGHDVGDVVALHAGATYRVAFCGFAPGFAYLSGLPSVLHLPRRVESRPNVPAGSVAIADRYSAVYPRRSPGGWHLIGTTSLVTWDPDRRPPALMAPGTTVRFTVAP